MRLTSIALLAVLTVALPARGAFAFGGGAVGFGGARMAMPGPTVAVAPQQTFVLANRQTVIVTQPFPIAQRALFVPKGLAVPTAFIPCHAVHHRLGNVVVFVDPAANVMWAEGFWWWNGAAWVWVGETLVW